MTRTSGAWDPLPFPGIGYLSFLSRVVPAKLLRFLAGILFLWTGMIAIRTYPESRAYRGQIRRYPQHSSPSLTNQNAL
jgi:hypothetical protein